MISKWRKILDPRITTLEVITPYYNYNMCLSPNDRVIEVRMLEHKKNVYLEGSLLLTWEKIMKKTQDPERN